MLGRLLLVMFMALGTLGFAQGKPKVGLVTINLQALFFNQVNDGAKKAAAEKGVDLVIVDGQNDPAKQVRAIETFVAQKVDAIIVLAIDVNGIRPAVEAAQKARIPVLAIDAKVAVPPASTFIGVDNYKAGLEAGQWLVKYVREKMGGRANVGIVGALNSFIQNQRRDGFLKALQEAPGIRVVATVDGQNVQEIALGAAENLITANRNLDFVYATGEPALIGVIAAVQSQKVTDRIKVVGWDLTKQAIEGLDKGYVLAVVQQDPYQEGYQAVLSALKLKAGEKVPTEILIPTTIVTRENVDKYRALFK